jgi:hypothetical protein
MNIHVHPDNIDGWLTLAMYIVVTFLIAWLFGAKKVRS